MLQTGGCDPLRDEAFAYAEALRAAGVETEFYCYQGLPHFFPGILFEIPETASFYERYMGFLRRFTGAGTS